MRYSILALAISIPAFTLIATGASGPERGLANRVAEMEAQVEELSAILEFVYVETDTINGLRGPHVIIEGANLHVRSGLGQTYPRLCPPGGPGSCVSNNRLGNLIVGYNELRPSPTLPRIGMHNVIVGPEHEYLSTGGLVAGKHNSIWNRGTSVTGGINNVARSSFASVSGGNENVALGSAASVSGGHGNVASGAWASVSGGQDREAPDDLSWAAGNLFEEN
jgi:hypothetical protein